MARFARVVAIEAWRHITRRGNARQVVFEGDADRLVYLTRSGGPAWQAGNPADAGVKTGRRCGAAWVVGNWWWRGGHDG
jgi:hypothetical protein